MQRQMGKGALYFWPVMAALGGVISTAPAFAQNADKIRLKSVLDLPREGYELGTLHAGNIILRQERDVRGDYDSKIYADETDRSAAQTAELQSLLVKSFDILCLQKP